MTVLAAMQSAAVRLMGRKPQTFFGGSGTFEIEIADLVNEVADDIAKYRDWQALVRTASIGGDGVTTEYDLPDDYDRMPVSSEVMDLTSWGYIRFTDINTFLLAQSSGFTGTPGGWIIYADKLRFSPAPSEPATFPYITKNWARAASEQPKSVFSLDTDTFLLPERLLTLGLVWRWREMKKLDASGDQEAFIKALDEYAAKDGGSRVQRRNSSRLFPGTRPAWPWELG